MPTINLQNDNTPSKYSFAIVGKASSFILPGIYVECVWMRGLFSTDWCQSTLLDIISHSRQKIDSCPVTCAPRFGGDDHAQHPPVDDVATPSPSLLSGLWKSCHKTLATIITVIIGRRAYFAVEQRPPTYFKPFFSYNPLTKKDDLTLFHLFSQQPIINAWLVWPFLVALVPWYALVREVCYCRLV